MKIMAEEKKGEKNPLDDEASFFSPFSLSACVCLSAERRVSSERYETEREREERAREGGERRKEGSKGGGRVLLKHR